MGRGGSLPPLWASIFVHWSLSQPIEIAIIIPTLSLLQAAFNCGPSSHPDFIKNYFLLTRMLEFFDRRDKFRKSGLEAPLMGGIGERKRRWRAREGQKWKGREELEGGGGGISLHFLSNSPFPPIPDCMIEQLMPPCIIIYDVSSLVFVEQWMPIGVRWPRGRAPPCIGSPEADGAYPWV